MRKKRKMTRRGALKLMGGTTGALLGTPMINLGNYQLFAGSESTYSSRAIDLVERSFVIDMCSPLTYNTSTTERWFRDPESFTNEDWERFRDSGFTVFNIAGGGGLPFFTNWNGFLANHDRFFMRIDSTEDLNRVKESGKFGVLLGLQRHPFKRVDDVNLFHSLGLRVAQLTYNSQNMIGSGSTERKDCGLSNFGIAIVERMNKVGMAVDVAHCGDQTTLDAFEFSKKPVLITHATCRALVPGHPRCKTDEAIRKMAAVGGVMGIVYVRNFVRDKEPTTIEHALDHFDYVKKLVGVEYLGVGSDLDLEGPTSWTAETLNKLTGGHPDAAAYQFREKPTIEGLDHWKRTYDLTEGLIRRNYSDSDIEGILGGNFKRVLSEIWSV